MLRFAAHLIRGLAPRRTRHSCWQYVNDTHCNPPACALCGRTIGA